MELSYQITHAIPACKEVFPCFAILTEPFNVFDKVLVMFVTCKTGFVLGSNRTNDVGCSWTENHNVYENPKRWNILPAGTKITLDLTIA